jgi:hypothetical protein
MIREKQYQPARCIPSSKIPSEEFDLTVTQDQSGG